MKKRIVSTLSLFGVIMTLVSPCSLAATVETTPYTAETPVKSLFSSTQVFIDEAASTASYSYSIVPNEEKTSAVVTLQFVIDNGNQTGTAQASGQVTAYPLNQGELLWEGPIYGSISIGGTDLPILIGFAKLDSSEDVQISVTISDSTNVSGGIQVLSFGNSVISREIYYELVGEAGDTNHIPPDQTEDITPRADEDFKDVITTYGYLTGEGATVGQRAKVYFDQYTNRVGVAINSYCEDLNDLFLPDNYWAQTNVSYFSIGIRRSNYENPTYSWISGIQTFDFNSSNFGKSNQLIKPLFYDFLNILNVPSNTIAFFLDNLKGTLQINEYTDSYSVTAEFGVTEGANFDSTSYPGPGIVFQLDCFNDYTGPSRYNLDTTIHYRTALLRSSSSTEVQFIYSDSENITTPFSVSLNP